MLDSEHQEMEYQIFKYFIYKKTKIWEIGTDFFGTWKRLGNKLINYQCPDQLPTEIKIKKIGDNKYKLLLIDKNDESIDITPNSQRGGWSKSAIRQFLQEGQIFDFLNWKSNLSNDEHPFSIMIMPAFWEIKFTSNVEKTIIDTSIKSLERSAFSDFQYIRNFGLSMLLYLSYLNDKQENLHFPSNSKLYNIEVRMKRETRNATEAPTTLGSENAETFILHYATKKRTYKICEYVYNSYGYRYEQIIENIYANLVEDNEFIEFKTINNFGNLSPLITEERISNIENLRNQIRDKTKVKRQEILNISISDSTRYYDLENAPGSNLSWEWLDACHILDVSSIRAIVSRLRPSDTEKYIEYRDKVIDPFNCLMLNKTLHSMFDKRKVYFDTNGYLKIKYDYNNSERVNETINSNLELDVLRVLGLNNIQQLENVHIRPEILNNSMIEYLKAK